jgi:uncharacterized protein (TIGR02646 family)
MRFVERPGQEPPAILRGSRAISAYNAIAKVLQLSESDRLARRPPIEREIFSNEAVHSALRSLFLGKCAYCECPVSDGEVDHFRPLSNARGLRGAQDKNVHHYSWLAYEWANLYLVCRECLELKGNFFGVTGKRAGLLSTLDETRSQEKPELIDPTFDRPERHLGFTSNGLCRGVTDRGRITTEVLGLNRDSLLSYRRTSFDLLKHQLLSETIDMEMIDYISSPDRPFSGSISIFIHQFLSAVAAVLGQSRPRFSGWRPSISKLLTFVDVAAREKVIASIDGGGRGVSVFGPAPSESGFGPPEQLSFRESAAFFRRRIEWGGPIRGVRINNFKGIEDLSIDIPGRVAGGATPCLMLLGENAAGKTSVLEAIALALVGSRRADSLKIQADSFLRREDASEWRLISRKPGSVSVELSNSTIEFGLEAADASFWGDGSNNRVIAYGSRRYFLDGRERRSSGLAGSIRGLFNPSATLPDPSIWLDKLDDRSFYKVARGLRDILSLDDEDALVKDDELGVCVRSHGMLTPIGRLSEGYKSIFALSVDIMRWILVDEEDLETARATVLIDEIETHLHPRWKMRLLGSLRAAMPGVQFIATTHDPLCLRGMADGEVIVLNRNATSRIEKLIDLPDVTGLSAEQLLTSDYFGLSSTADPVTEREIARLADASIYGADQGVIAALAEALADKVVLGRTAAEQVAAEAMAYYLKTREIGSATEISESRKSIIRDIVSLIESEEVGRSNDPGR